VFHTRQKFKKYVVHLFEEIYENQNLEKYIVLHFQSHEYGK
jgi:hypothetical protein